MAQLSEEFEKRLERRREALLALQRLILFEAREMVTELPGVGRRGRHGDDLIWRKDVLEILGAE